MPQGLIKDYGSAVEISDQTNLSGSGICLAWTGSSWSRLVFGISLKDVSPKEKMANIEIDNFLSKSPGKLEVEKNFMQEECRKVM